EFLSSFQSSLHLRFFFFSSRRRHTRSKRDWSSDVCSSDLASALTIVSCAEVNRFSRRDTKSRSSSMTVKCPKRCSKGCVSAANRSEERRVGKEWRARGGPQR